MPRVRKKHNLLDVSPTHGQEVYRPSCTLSNHLLHIFPFLVVPLSTLKKGIGTDDRPRKKRKRDKDRKRKRERKTSNTKPSGSPFWSEHLIEEFVRLRREQFGNANAWTEIAALMPPKPEGYGRWTAQELANMWHLGNSSVKRFCRKDGKLNAIKNCVSDKTGDWLADYKKKK